MSPNGIALRLYLLGLYELQPSLAATKYEGFQFLDEGSTRAHADPSPYVVPQRSDPGVFSLPAALFTRGWIHVLEDSELTFLMMLADWTQNVQARTDRTWCCTSSAW